MLIAPYARIIAFMLEILRRRFGFLLKFLDLEVYVFMILFFALNLENYKYAEIIYDFTLEDFLKKNDERITSLRTSIATWYY